MNMCLLEVTMCEKCGSSHFQLEGGVKSLRIGGGGGGGKKILGLGGYQFWEITFAVRGGGSQYPITCHVFIA